MPDRRNCFAQSAKGANCPTKQLADWCLVVTTPMLNKGFSPISLSQWSRTRTRKFSFCEQHVLTTWICWWFFYQNPGKKISWKSMNHKFSSNHELVFALSRHSAISPASPPVTRRQVRHCWPALIMAPLLAIVEFSNLHWNPPRLNEHVWTFDFRCLSSLWGNWLFKRLESFNHAWISKHVSQNPCIFTSISRTHARSEFRLVFCCFFSPRNAIWALQFRETGKVREWSACLLRFPASKCFGIESQPAFAQEMCPLTEFHLKNGNIV